MPDTRYEHTITADDREYRFQVYVPEGYEGRPTSTLEVLQRAKALLQEEGRWLSGDWFRNNHPSVDPEDAFCNSWGVCMDGALIAVDVGLRGTKQGYYDEYTVWACTPDSITDPDDGIEGFIDAPHVVEARQLLVEAGGVLWPQFVADNLSAYEKNKAEYGELSTSVHDWPPFRMYVPNFNDGVVKSRTEAIEWLDKAIELASSEAAATA